jgi:hypothetical protein
MSIPDLLEPTVLTAVLSAVQIPHVSVGVVAVLMAYIMRKM